ncbi:MAG: amino acid permease [Gammaproteobacteria bacterium]
MNNDQQQLQRRLRSRHVTMIAIGGSLGTGLFVASGNAIYTAGPWGALLAYAITGFLVYFLMTSLAEMTAYMPTSGAFCKYCSDFVSPSFGLAMGYNYFFDWASAIAVEISAASFLVRYWFPNISFTAWSAIFFFAILIINLFPVRIYGESEYFMSSIKIIAIVAFIIVGTLLITGVIGHQHIGFANWHTGLLHGNWKTLLVTFLVAGFSFQGTELVGITAGEVDNPAKNMPRAARSVFWRIFVFYFLTIAIICFIIPSTDSRLIHASSEHIALSPFTIIFSQAGLRHAASIINLVILMAVLSACNSDTYSASRILWHLADEGHAPKVLTKTNRHGTPIYAVLITAVFGSLVFLSSFFGNGRMFLLLVSISSLSGFIAWLGIAISHYRFRKAFLRQGNNLNILPYRAKFYPFGPIICIVGCVVIILGQLLVLKVQGQWNLHSIIATYILIPILILLWFVSRFFYKKAT